MGNLSASYHVVGSLDDTLRESMFALFERYYGAVTLEQFLHDLESKTIAILLLDNDGVLQGFSTLEIIFFNIDDGSAVAVYSGDTIISHEHWGEQKLSYAWCYFAGQIKQQYPEIPLYWFLIVKGHRTYRYLPAFTRKFYPSYREITPPKLQEIVDQLATEKFGDAYDPVAGILHFAQSRGYLRPEWVDLNDAVKSKPHVAYFLRANPGHAAGDELVCLTELSDRNMRFVSRTAFIEGMNSCPNGVKFDRPSPDSAIL